MAQPDRRKWLYNDDTKRKKKTSHTYDVKKKELNKELKVE